MVKLDRLHVHQTSAECRKRKERETNGKIIVGEEIEIRCESAESVFLRCGVVCRKVISNPPLFSWNLDVSEFRSM